MFAACTETFVGLCLMLLWNVVTVRMSMHEPPNHSSCSGGARYIIQCFKTIFSLKKKQCGRGLKLQRYLPSHKLTMCTNNRAIFLCTKPWIKFTFIECLWMHNSSSQDCNTKVCHKMFNNTDQARLKIVLIFKCFPVFHWFFRKYTW